MDSSKQQQEEKYQQDKEEEEQRKITIINDTICFVKNALLNIESGHDWWHTYRVWQCAKTIAKKENGNLFVVELASLLHDIADSKFYNGDETIGPRRAKEFLLGQQRKQQQQQKENNIVVLDDDCIEHIINIIQNISFRNSIGSKESTEQENDREKENEQEQQHETNEKDEEEKNEQRNKNKKDKNHHNHHHDHMIQKQFHSLELQIVQDADRLDAMGAIGIARTFNYGGYKHRTIYDPTIPPNFNLTKEEYKSSTSPTINHFYEKLLLLKDQMNTKSGQQMAKHRHAFMETYLQQFYQEWEGNS